MVLEMYMRLYQAAYASAQLYYCIWERIARGRCSQRLHNPRLLSIEWALVNAGAKELSQRTSDYELFHRLVYEAFFFLLSFRAL